MRQRNYDDDDGRTIADMSGLERQPMLLPHLPKRNKKDAGPEQAPQPGDAFSDGERRSYIGGALSAAMLIGGIFIGAGAVVILLLTLLWR